MLLRVPRILAVTAASYGLSQQDHGTREPAPAARRDQRQHGVAGVRSRRRAHHP
jgi:hypothetical protein